MRRVTLLILLFMGIATCVQSQTNNSAITIKGIMKDEADLSARTGPGVKTNSDGDNMAIIKINTCDTGFEFDIGVTKPVVEYKTGEVWIYASPGIRFFSMAHPKYGKSDNYSIPMRIESSNVYVLDVEFKGTDGQVVVLDYGFLVVKTEPKDALVYINDNLAENIDGVVMMKYGYGTYSVRVESYMHHPFSQKVNLRKDTQPLEVKLIPNFGWLNIVTTPESGADIRLNGKLIGQKTPFKSDRLASGEYTVMVNKDMFRSVEQKVTVRDNEVTEVNMTMPANFGDVSISSTVEGADIYIDGVKKGTTSWKGRLGARVYSVEARKDRHVTAKQDIEVVNGVAQTVELKPKPIVGNLDIMCRPLGSEITINGKKHDVPTPTTITGLLIGEYEIALSSPGYSTEIRKVTIEEGKTATLEAILSTGKSITITSTPSGAKLYVDGIENGITPKNIDLSYGEHTLKIVDKGKENSQKITVTQNGQSSYELKLGPSNQTITVKGISFDMIAVEGGTFEMGDTYGGGDSDEKPIHSVTLSDYYIGKTEVTQALWEAVMGSNPSYFKGSNIPVEQVSWNACQKFIRKLNAATGKTFRLPTEAEWEYAAKGGNKSKGYKYSGSNDINSVSWYDSNSGSTTHVVGTKQSNELGLYDMSGNVWEWCSDWSGAYSSNAQRNPTGATRGSYRVTRGGCWGSNVEICRVAIRFDSDPENRYSNVGLRLVFVP